ncbi:MAG: hypothetical protein QM487_04200 [Candidatus Marithrix sp.]
MLNQVKKVVSGCKNYIMRSINLTKELDPLEEVDLLSAQELKLSKDLDRTHEIWSHKEFTKWTDHYNVELYSMYHEFIHDNEKIDYETFIKIAYQCTETSFCYKMHKHIKPLV